MHTPPPNAPENEPHSRPAVCPPQIFVITSLPVVQEALLLRAIESFEDVQDGKRVKRVPGDKWMFYGPGDYIPPVQVEVLEQRRAMALDENEVLHVAASLPTNQLLWNITRSRPS